MDNTVLPPDVDSSSLAYSLRIDQINLLYASAPISYIGSGVAAVAAVGALRGYVPDHLSLLWISITILVVFARGLLSWRFARCTPEQQGDVR